MARIAFIGLGKMGTGMAQRLIAAGHTLTIYNRTPDKAAPLVSLGARLVTTPRLAAEGADAIFSMVADDEASRSVWLGEGGVLAGRPASGALAIECSTLSHDWVLELAGEAGRRGLSYLDCPVTGLPDMAAAGRLTLLVGAAPEVLDAARPLLEPISEKIVHFGPVGAGTVYKLMVNLIGAVQIASAAEGMAIAERAGLDLGLVADAIASGQAASPQVVRNTRRMADGDHDRNVVFTPPLRVKDVNYALRLARKLGVASPFGTVAEAMFRRLCEQGLTQVNESKVIDIARTLKG